MNWSKVILGMCLVSCLAWAQDDPLDGLEVISVRANEPVVEIEGEAKFKIVVASKSPLQRITYNFYRPDWQATPVEFTGPFKRDDKGQYILETSHPLRKGELRGHYLCHGVRVLNSNGDSDWTPEGAAVFFDSLANLQVTSRSTEFVDGARVPIEFSLDTEEELKQFEQLSILVESVLGHKILHYSERKVRFKKKGNKAFTVFDLVLSPYAPSADYTVSISLLRPYGVHSARSFTIHMKNPRTDFTSPQYIEGKAESEILPDGETVVQFSILVLSRSPVVARATLYSKGTGNHQKLGERAGTLVTERKDGWREYLVKFSANLSDDEETIKSGLCTLRNLKIVNEGGNVYEFTDSELERLEANVPRTVIP
jgi:hypothetical protein